MVFSQVVIVKFYQRLDCFIHRAQLDESHFSVFPESINNILRLPGNIMATSVELKFVECLTGKT